MGLGLALDFLPRPTGLLRRRAGAEVLARALLAEAVRAWPLLDGYARVEVTGRNWSVWIVPCEEPVEVEQVANRVRFSARTSTCGPGYHAFLVGLLDRVAQSDGGAWHDAGVDEESTLLDETEYFEERDFAKLQGAMSGWLRALASSVATRDLGDSSSICMSIDSPESLEPGHLTPCGVRPREYFDALAHCEGESLARGANEWFAWWNEGTQAAPLGLSRALLFQLPWHVPASDAERAEMVIALVSVKLLPPETRFGRDTADSLREELEALLAPGASDGPPRANRFGYRRDLVRFHPHVDCTVLLPGYWHRTLVEAPGVVGYWHADRSVHVSVYAAKFEDGPRSAASILDEERVRRPPSALWHCEWKEAGNQGLAWCERRESDSVFHVLTVLKAADGILVHATITYTSESDHGWAKETGAGIRAVSRGVH